MKKYLLLIILTFIFCQILVAQTPDWRTIYRVTHEKKFDLIHTKLDVRFDFDKHRLMGKEWVSMKPHFYAQDSLVLDAKGMQINKISVLDGAVIKDLSYTYADTMQLHIKLDKTYQAIDSFILYIDYVAKPDEMTFPGSAAIKNAKGLYFIGPDKKDSTKPVSVWTQGETEANSVWFPTIDKPNQKCTDEILMTVPAKFVTLSNGVLKGSVVNKDGTRTDDWHMDLPHSVYLFFMGAGEFSIIRDKYKNIPVDYYVEPKYVPVARKIFGLTPEMIGFYSKALGVEYPWPKYDQMVGRDYVSGAMENTTATLHQFSAYQKSRDLVDGNKWESTIAHELFHQWFGDYVTAESWSNITVNETMANYSQVLWAEHKYGKDAGAEENYNDMQKYLRVKANENKQLVRFYYNDKEDVFDLVSYEKGGRIQNMLRNYLGDSAYFKGLHKYLSTNKFGNGEAQQMRLAFEDVSGRDLNWFYNEWFYNIGHPIVDISYAYNDAAGNVAVTIKQNQTTHLFQFPIAVDVYSEGSKTRTTVWVKDSSNTFVFPYTTHPNLVNVDADKVMLWVKHDPKSADNYMFQYRKAGNYMDRREALDSLANMYDNSATQKQFWSDALNDTFETMRQKALLFWKKHTNDMDNATEEKIFATAQTFYNNPTRAIAIDVLSKKNGAKYEPFFLKSVTDSSYSVAGAALEGLVNVDLAKAIALQPQLKKDEGGRLAQSLRIVDYLQKTDADADSVTAEYKRMSMVDKAINQKAVFYYLSKLQDVDKFKKLVGPIIESYTTPGRDFGNQKATTLENINWLLDKKQVALTADLNNNNLQEEIKYIQEKLKG